MPIIDKWVDAEMGCVVVINHFSDLLKDASKKRHPFIRNAFSFCFFSTLEHLIRVSADRITEDDKIAADFDYGNLGRVGSVSPSSPWTFSILRS